MVDLELPLLETSFRVSLKELEEPEALLEGDSDLAELNRATDGAVGRQLGRVFHTPLPVQTNRVVAQLSGTPLLQQALLAATTLGEVDGLQPDLSGDALNRAVEEASVNGELTLLALLRAMPGESVRVDLARALGGISEDAGPAPPGQRPGGKRTCRGCQ